MIFVIYALNPGGYTEIKTQFLQWRRKKINNVGEKLYLEILLLLLLLLLIIIITVYFRVAALVASIMTAWCLLS